jgi:hypothetical protein
VLPPLTSVKENPSEDVPRKFDLRQNYPNPFNPETTIRFELPRQAEVTLRIFNLLGEEVATLINEKMPAGMHTLKWDGRNVNQRQVGSGIYLLILKAGNETTAKKMALIR